jgi:hypothetical protein
LIKAQLELHQLQRARRVLEASTNADYWLSSYVDLLDRYRDGDRLGYPISQPTDRRYGQNWPFWNTETQLSLFRAQARYLCSTNSYAIGLLGGLQAYVIGDGFQYRVVTKEKHGGKPSSLIPQVQAIVDEFCEVNQWWDWEQELFWRSREDGEYFLRYYPDAELQCLTVRSVEPEQVCTTGIPEGAAGAWSFGILTDPEDVQEIYAYNVLYLASPAEHSTDIREEVPVEDLQHFKINVRRTIKRGLTDFCYSTYDALHLAEKLRNNLAEGAAVQAALAYIRQHESATQAQVQNFLNTQQLDFSRTNPLTGLSINYKHLEPGSVVDIPRGMQYVQPPGAGNASGFIEILHASLRGAGCRWNAPEWLATASGADMAAYTASLTAHAPFVRTATQKQKSYKQAYTRVIKEAIQVAIDYGRLPPETFDIIDIQCEAPSIPAKSELDEAQANQIRVQGGWKSRQTVQQEEGLDPQRELQNIEDYNRRMSTGDKAGSLPVQETNFNPNEPRDERGRWTKVGGSEVGPFDQAGDPDGAGSAFGSLPQPGLERGAFTLLQAQQPMLRPPVQVAPPSGTAPTIRPTPSGFTPPSWWLQEPPPREFIPADIDPTQLSIEDIFRRGGELLRDREYREAIDRLAEAARKAGAPADQVEAIRQDALGPSIGGSSIDKYRVGMAKLRQLQQLYQGKEWLQKWLGIPADQIKNVIHDGMRDNPDNPFQGVFDRAYRYRRQKYEQLLRDLKMIPQPAAAGAGKGAGRRHGWWDDENVRSQFERIKPWLTDEQAGILLNNPEAAPEEISKALERIYNDPKAKPSLPPYTGGKTSGVLRTPEQAISLQSGWHGPALDIARGTSGFDIVTRTHVEGHAAAFMRLNGIKEATIHINNPTICSSCSQLLPRMLPPGSKLHVVLPNGRVETFEGK